MLDKIKVGILDLGINNTQSIFSSFRICGYNTQLIKPKHKKYNFDILVLPGVGAFPMAMKIIKKIILMKKFFHSLIKTIIYFMVFVWGCRFCLVIAKSLKK